MLVTRERSKAIMEYRKLGSTELEVSVIGLGTEHMDQQQDVMTEVLDVAVEAGLNYIDLLYIDPTGDDAGFWENIGPTLKRHRDKLVLAAHWGGGPRYDLPYCQRTFPEVLSRVGNDYVEVAIMTMIDEPTRWGKWMQTSLEHLKRYQEKGHVGFVGGSAHDPAIALKAVESGLIDVLMFGVNLTAHGRQEYQDLYQACIDHQVGLVAMKPYFGGTLLYVDGKPTTITPVQCLSYVLSQPVSTTVPGVKNADHMRAALRYCRATEKEKDFEPALTHMYHDLEGHCVYCNHCLPCPQQIDIAGTIVTVDWARWGISDELKRMYADLTVPASDCIACGECMERCPFGVDVIAKMEQAVALFE